MCIRDRLKSIHYYFPLYTIVRVFVMTQVRTEQNRTITGLQTKLWKTSGKNLTWLRHKDFYLNRCITIRPAWLSDTYSAIVPRSILNIKNMSSKTQAPAIAADRFAGFYKCGGRRCPDCGFCSDWYYDRREQHWVRHKDYTCSRAHVNADDHKDLDAYTLQAREICACSRRWSPFDAIDFMKTFCVSYLQHTFLLVKLFSWNYKYLTDPTT